MKLCAWLRRYLAKCLEIDLLSAARSNRQMDIQNTPLDHQRRHLLLKRLKPLSKNFFYLYSCYINSFNHMSLPSIWLPLLSLRPLCGNGLPFAIHSCLAPNKRRSARKAVGPQPALSAGSGLPYASITRYLFHFGSTGSRAAMPGNRRFYNRQGS